MQQREFNFRRIPNTSIETFHVDVSDDKMNRIMFTMKKAGTHWKIADTSLPEWVCNVEQKLHEILETENPATWKLNSVFISE